jgi:hypothetical protein
MCNMIQLMLAFVAAHPPLGASGCVRRPTEAANTRFRLPKCRAGKQQPPERPSTIP